MPSDLLTSPVLFFLFDQEEAHLSFILPFPIQPTSTNHDLIRYPPGLLLLDLDFSLTTYILSFFLKYFRSFGVRVVIVLVAFTYGPEMSLRSFRRRVCSNNSSCREWSMYFFMMMNSSSRCGKNDAVSASCRGQRDGRCFVRRW